jgi:hypothetical protein
MLDDRHVILSVLFTSMTVEDCITNGDVSVVTFPEEVSMLFLLSTMSCWDVCRCKLVSSVIDSAPVAEKWPVVCEMEFCCPTICETAPSLSVLRVSVSAATK